MWYGPTCPALLKRWPARIMWKANLRIIGICILIKQWAACSSSRALRRSESFSGRTRARETSSSHGKLFVSSYANATIHLPWKHIVRRWKLAVTQRINFCPLTLRKWWIMQYSVYLQYCGQEKARMTPTPLSANRTNKTSESQRGQEDILTSLVILIRIVAASEYFPWLLRISALSRTQRSASTMFLLRGKEEKKWVVFRSLGASLLQLQTMRFISTDTKRRDAVQCWKKCVVASLGHERSLCPSVKVSGIFLLISLPTILSPRSPHTGIKSTQLDSYIDPPIDEINQRVKMRVED